MSASDRIRFKFITLMHDKLFSVFVNPYQQLHDAGVRKGQTILEVGFGPGFFTIPTAKIVGKNGFVHAVDINQFALKYVQKKIDKANIENVHLFLEDVSSMSLEDSCIDLSFMFGVYHSFDQPIEVLKEVHRVLNEIGVLSIQTGRVSSEDVLRQVIDTGLFTLKEQQGKILQFRKVL